MATYPSGIYPPKDPTPTTIRHATGGISLATAYGDIEDEVVAIQTALGLDPKTIDDTATVGTPTDVADYLDMTATRLKGIVGGVSWQTAVPASLTTLNDRFDTTTGHDHDGSDSKTIPFTTITGRDFDNLTNKPTGLTGGAAHGSAAHTGTIGTWAQVDKATSSIADITTRTHSLLASIGADDHHNQSHSDSDHSGANKVEIEKAGADIGTRATLNFIEGANVTLTVADDAGNEEVDITIAATGGLGTVEVKEDTVQVLATAGALDFTNGLDVTDAGGNVAQIDVDESELDHTLIGNQGTDDHHNITHGILAPEHGNNLLVTNAGVLDVDYTGGIAVVNETYYDILGGTITLADDDVSYVYVGTDGAVADNTTGFPVNSIPLAEVTTVSGDITILNDRRGLFSTRDDGLKKDGSVALTADWDVGDYRISNLSDPTDLKDAVNLVYLEDNLNLIENYYLRGSNLLSSTILECCQIILLSTYQGRVETLEVLSLWSRKWQKWRHWRECSPFLRKPSGLCL